MCNQENAGRRLHWNSLYEISILEASPNGFKAKAQAVQDFNGDGQYNIWEIDQEGVLKEVQPD